MNRTQLIRILSIFGGALLLWGVLAVVRRPPSDRPERLMLPKVDTASLDTIAIGSITLTRSNGVWRVNGYVPAPDAIAELKKGLADTSATTELVAESKTSHDRLGVGADRGKRVHVVSHGKPTLDLIAGTSTHDAQGVYFRRPDENAVYAFHGGLATSVNKSLDDWRDKHIVSVVPESVSVATLQRGSHTITMRRAHGDTTRLNTLLGSYRDLRASGFADSISAHPAMRVRLTDKSGATLVNLVFDSTASGVRVRADSGGTIYRLDTWMLGQLLPAKCSPRRCCCSRWRPTRCRRSSCRATYPKSRKSSGTRFPARPAP